MDGELTGAADAPRLALTIQYLGGAYAGWQAQENALAIQTVVERGVARAYGVDRRIALQGAARTDAGVHARMQVAHFDPPFAIPPRGLLRALEPMLPDDVRVVAVAEVPRAFHALDSAIGKEYHYRLRLGGPASPLQLLTTGAGPAPSRFDLGRVREAMALLPGACDYALVRKSGTTVKTTRRRLFAASVDPEETPAPPLPALPGFAVATSDAEVVRFRFHGDGFLRGTVRLLVGTLVRVGQGLLPPTAPRALLDGDPSTGPAGPSMPASGLVLWRVDYPAGGSAAPPPPALW